MAIRLEDSIPSIDGSGIKRWAYHLGSGLEVHVSDRLATMIKADGSNTVRVEMRSGGRFTIRAEMRSGLHMTTYHCETRSKTLAALHTLAKAKPFVCRGIAMMIEHDVELQSPTGSR